MSVAVASELALSAPVAVLRRLLEVPARLAPSRSSLPVLSCVRLSVADGVLEVEGGDLELRARSSAPLLAGSEGVVTVPAARLSAMLAALPGAEVGLSVADGCLVLRSGRTVFRCRCVAAPEWPSWIDLPGGVEVDEVGFRAAAGSVLCAASVDDARPVLTGVRLEPVPDGVRLVATDSYRLHVATVPGLSLGAGADAMLLPARALGELFRFADDGPLRVAVDGRRVQFRSAGVTLSASTIDGEYPRWPGLVPSVSPITVRCDPVALAEAVRRVRVAAEAVAAKGQASGSSVVRVVFAEGEGAVLSSGGDESAAEDFCAAVVDGPAVALAFNPGYLLDALDCAGDCGEVVVGMSDSRSPVTVRRAGAEDAWLGLLMPVRVS